MCPGEVSLLSPPEGVGDFAEVAWVVAQALGNGAGVRGLDVHRGETGAPVRLRPRPRTPRTSGPVAASFGWSLFEPDEDYANVRDPRRAAVSVSLVPADLA